MKAFEVNELKCFFVMALDRFGEAPIHDYELYKWAEETFGKNLEFEDFRFNDRDWAEFPRLASLKSPMVVDRLEQRWLGKKKDSTARYRIALRFPPKAKIMRPVLEAG